MINSIMTDFLYKIVDVIGKPPGTVPGFIQPSDAPAKIAAAFNLFFIFCTIVAVFFFTKGGLDYIMSAGDAGKLKTGLATLQYSIMGLIVAGLGFTVISIVKNLLGIDNIDLTL